jgi:hypothetical protein
MTYVTICSYRLLELIDSYSHYNPTEVGFGTIFFWIIGDYRESKCLCMI